MGIIEYKVREAFKKFYEDGDAHKFAHEMAHIGDYSVRSMTHWGCLVHVIDKIKKEDMDSTIKNLSFNFQKELPK
jgi:uncharacterized protein YutD